MNGSAKATARLDNLQETQVKAEGGRIPQKSREKDVSRWKKVCSVVRF